MLAFQRSAQLCPKICKVRVCMNVLRNRTFFRKMTIAATEGSQRLADPVNMDTFENCSLSDVDAICKELTDGNGFYRIESAFSVEDMVRARDLIHHHITIGGRKATHFQGKDESKIDLQARVWNLLNKGEIFSKMVLHPKILAIGERLLGDDFQLGSIASNTLFPGAVGQEPHIDYPYWDYFERKHWPQVPKVEHVHFHMNMQVTILLDDFTVENGATAVVPGTQKVPKYPVKEEFFHACTQTLGKSGDVIVFLGLLHHCAMPNNSNQSRSAVLIQCLPKFVRPMEDIKQVLLPDVATRATPRMRCLLGMDYPYPAVMDEAEPVNSEGSMSNFKWK